METPSCPATSPRNGRPPLPPPQPATNRLGHPPGSGEGFASGQEQVDGFKELVNKLAWVLGSTYKHPYSSKKGPVHELAVRAARSIVRATGYPKSK